MEGKLTEVLAAHVFDPARLQCFCGWRPDQSGPSVVCPAFAQHLADAITAAGMSVVPSDAALDHEDLWDANQFVQDWRDSDNCDDTPEHRRRLSALAERLRNAANALAGER